jgi:hypothetical protein
MGDQQIEAWDNLNRASDSRRPSAYGYSVEWGKKRGTARMAAKDWQPYLPTPPFPSYTSGHSLFTAT